MKKLLMFAAAMTIVGGAFAQCAPGETNSVNCALVYSVSVSLKTTVAKSLGAKSECESSVCYRDIGSLKLTGYLYGCACDCKVGAFQNSVLTLWDAKKKDILVFEEFIDWFILHRIGKKADKVEALGNIGDEEGFVMAGFGKYDNKNGRVSSINGSVIGVIEGPWCEDVVNCEPQGEPALPIDICYDEQSDEYGTIAFGTFALKYNSSASKKYADDNQYVYEKLLPDYKD